MTAGDVRIGESWRAPLAVELESPYMAGLRSFLTRERGQGKRIFPKGAEYFRALDLTPLSDVKVVILRLPDLQVLDATGAQALGEIVAELEARHITVLIKRPRPEHLRTLRAVGTLDRLAHQRHLFHDLDEALDHARLHIERAVPSTTPA